MSSVADDLADRVIAAHDELVTSGDIGPRYGLFADEIEMWTNLSNQTSRVGVETLRSHKTTSIGQIRYSNPRYHVADDAVIAKSDGSFTNKDGTERDFPILRIFTLENGRVTRLEQYYPADPTAELGGG